jgi:arsenate reductase
VRWASTSSRRLTDPAGQDIEVVRGVRDEIRGRVEALLKELVLASE